MEFQVYLNYDFEYKGFVADCPTLPGCMSQGKTKEEALANIKEAIEAYVEVLKKHEKTTVPVFAEQPHYVKVPPTLYPRSQRVGSRIVAFPN